MTKAKFFALALVGAFVLSLFAAPVQAQVKAQKAQKVQATGQVQKTAARGTLEYRCRNKGRNNSAQAFLKFQARGCFGP